MNTIKVILADNQLITRKGYLQVLLNHPGYCFSVTEVVSKQDLIEKAGIVKPEIIIIDPYAIDFKSLRELSEINLLLPKTNIMVISTQIVANDISEILDCNVNQYLLKNCSEGELNICIEAAVKSKKYLSSKILDALLFAEPLAHVLKVGDDIKLTTTEKEIIKFVAKGFSTREIAFTRKLSPHTVNTHRKNIMKKLKMKNSSELVMYAFQHGMAETSDYFI
jgi:DNA-binding NarL/FixJ family response regulator